MTSLATSTLRKNLADVLNRVKYKGERIVLTRRRKDVAAIVSMEDLAFLQRLEDFMDIEDARAALAEAEEKGTVSLSSLMDELGF